MSASPETKRWAALDRRYAQQGLPTGYETRSLILERGSGCHVWVLDGREYLDAWS